jgi:cardiolipin synthase
MVSQMTHAQLWDFILTWYWLPLSIIYLSVISTILIENRHPSKTIAWILVIVFIPIIGVVLYYFFGQKYIKEQHYKANHQYLQRKIAESWDQLDPWIRDSLQQLEGALKQQKDVFSFLAYERVSPPIANNKISLLINGEEKFPSLIRALKEAKHHIHLEYYIFEEDTIGLRILEILAQKAQEGVMVRLIIDGFGSSRLAKNQKFWRVKGVNIQVFMPVGFRSLANSNYRNHRKLALVDGKTAYIGGINVSDTYLNSSEKKLYWRDTSLRMEGAAVNVLQAYFYANWLITGGEEYALTADYFYTDPLESLGDATLSFAMSDPGSQASYTLESILIAIASATHRVSLCTPYFIPPDELSMALQLAAARGVVVELYLPAKSDSYIVQHASMSFLKPLLMRGVHVYFYQKGFLHAKTLIIDQQVAAIGTVNLDTRSFYINFESMAFVYDPTFVAEMLKQTEVDKENCTLLTLEEWMNRPKWKRGLDSICRLLAPIL